MKTQRKIAGKRDLVTVEHCSLKIMASRESAGNADIIIEKNGEELFRGNENYFWLMRFCSPTIGETIWASIFRGKKV